MSNELKRKGRKTISKRAHEDLEHLQKDSYHTLEELFEIFIKAKEIEGLRERTLTDHKRHFNYFQSYVRKFHPILKKAIDISTNTIRDYIHYLKNEKGVWDDHEWLAEKHAHKKGLSPVTINVRLRSLKCFFKFLYEDGYLSSNPCERIKLLKTEDDTIESFTPQQVKKLLEQPNQKTFVGFRDYVLMLVMLDTGIRISELLGLVNRNFNYEQKTLSVPASVAKNKQNRVLPLSKHTAKSLNMLIKENLALESEIEYIFMTNYGEKLEPYVVRGRLKDYGKQANIEGVRVSPHTFRHTFAKLYILNGGDAFTLQRLLDHSTMNMVRKYIQMNTHDVQNQHLNFSPVENLLKKRK